MTIGKKNVTKLNKTILLVGETGAGKSTLIDALVNYAFGVTWEDEIWFKIVEEEKKSQSESQTSDVMVYQIFGFEDQTLPFSLTIIDTPGYGDTRGTEHDVIVSERLLDWFRSEDGVHEINAVGLVMKASVNRLSDRLRYIFDSIMSLFSKNIEKNIVALITHSDGRRPRNTLEALEKANIKCARDEDNQPVYFLFDNCQTDDRTENQEKLEHSHKIRADHMSQFTEFLETAEPRTLVTTVTVLNERVKLTACIKNLQERIEFIKFKQREIKQTQEALKKHEQEMKDNENFTVEVDESYKKKKSIDGGGRWWGLWLNYEGATTCNVCQENCHYPGCTVAWYAKDCEVMKGGRCTSCTGKCPVTDHVKEKWIYVTKTRKVKKTLNEIKEKYEAERENKLSLLENLQRKMEELQRDRDGWLDEAFKHVETLEQIALNVNSVSTHVHLDFLIEEMKERRDKEKVQKLKEKKRRVETDKGFRAAVWYMSGMFGKLSAAWQSSSRSDE